MLVTCKIGQEFISESGITGSLRDTGHYSKYAWGIVFFLVTKCSIIEERRVEMSEVYLLGEYPSSGPERDTISVKYLQEYPLWEVQ